MSTSMALSTRRARVAATCLVALGLLGFSAREAGAALLASPSGSPDAVNIGSAAVGATTTPPVTITITNNGNDDAPIAISFTGADGPRFAVSGLAPVSVSGTTSCGGAPNCNEVTIDLEFTPNAIGAVADAQMVVTDTSTAGNSVSVDLTGTGLGSQVDLSPTSLTFSPLQVGAPAAQLDVSVTNGGNTTLDVTAVSKAAGADCDHFNVPTTSFTDTGTISVFFSPTAAGTFTCIITITSNAAAGDKTFTASGTGTVSALVIGSQSLAFNNTRVGSSDGPRSFTLSNTGAASLEVTDVSINVADNDEDYSITLTGGAPLAYPITIAGGSSIDIFVTFQPQAVGQQDATINITSDANVNPTGTKSATGRGIERRIALNPTSIAIGDALVGGNRTGSLNVLNSGEDTLTVTSVGLSGGNAARFIITTATNFTVAGGGSSAVTVRCSPTSVGNLSTTLTVNSNADNAPANPSASVTCRGVKPDILIDGTDPNVTAPPPITLATTDVGSTSAAAIVVVRNANFATTSTLRVTGVTITGTNSGDFSVTPTGPFNVARNGTRNLSVTFSPSARGTRTATLTINSDDQETPSVTIALSGTGQQQDILLVQPSPPSIDFGDTLVGANSGTRTVQIQNEGNKTLRITAVGISTSATQFTIVSGPSAPPTKTVAPAATMSWTVRCNPTTTGAKTGNFRITSDDPDESPLNIALSCNGIESKLLVTPSPVAFPDTRVCETASPITVVIANDGTADLDVIEVSLGGGEFSFTTPPPAGAFTLTPKGTANATRTIAIDFSPLNGGARDVVLTINSNDPSGLRSIPVQGRGLVNSVGVNKMTFAYGDVRVDQPAASDTLTVTNTGDSTFLLSPPMLSNTTDFAVSGTTPPLPALLSAGGSATITIDALPTTVGDKTGTLTLATDLPAPACGPPVTILNLTAKGIAPDISVTPTTLDFGGHDIQDLTPTVQNVTIMNTGTAPLAVSSLAISGTDQSVFNLASTVPATLDIPAGGSSVVAVEYLPTIERVGTDKDVATLTVTSDAGSGATVQVTLNGQGTDRHISTDPGSIMFPNTYRNPDEPVVRTFKVLNTGAAPLAISMTVKGGDGAAAYTITQPSMRIDGGMDDTVTVSFNPTAGVDFPAYIDITNDDSDTPLRRVVLTGAGVDPRLQIVPNGEIDLGVTGVGVSITLSDKLPDGVQVVNMESDAFRVRELKLALPMGEDPVSADMFQVRDFTADTEIGALGKLPFDMVFSPDRAGVFRILVEVYVNNDPLRVTYVTFKGEAVDVKVRGGGCSAGGGVGGDTTGGGLVLFVLLGGLLATRRRRSALVGGARGGRRTVHIGWLVTLLVCAGLALAPAAQAEPTRNLDIRNFRPMPEVEPSMLSVQSADVGKDGAWSLRVFLNHATNPLTVESPQREGMSDSPITGRSAAELAFAYAFGGRFEAGALLSVVQQAGDEPAFSGLQPATGTAIGDFALHGKARILSTSLLSLAGAATITLPTASNDQFVGVDGPTVHAQGLLGVRTGRIQLAANAGIRLRGKGALGDLEQGNEMSYGLAAAYRVQEKLFAIGELFGALGMGGGVTTGVSPLEASLGVRYRLSRQIGVSTGAGRGILPGIGSPDVRAFLLVSYSPQARGLEPLYIPPPPKIVDRGDADGDGILNFEDECKNDPEDKDGFEDEDGCPDNDNDNDGVGDALDKCPLKAEDKDGFKDGDGCPDLDNDKDGIPDVKDKCPNEPEDKDGYQDRDGCDDPDNDSDGIPDVIDQCALEPETINGKQDDDGCPDAGDSLVMVLPDRVEVYEQVRFSRRTSTIKKKSNNVLGQVAATLRANREFVRIRIAVHVHPRGAGDLKLTKRRAKAVRQWLIKWGIEPERLEAKGFGSTRLLVPRRSKGAAAINDRVEFIIIEKRLKKKK